MLLVTVFAHKADLKNVGLHLDLDCGMITFLCDEHPEIASPYFPCHIN